MSSGENYIIFDYDTEKEQKTIIFKFKDNISEAKYFTFSELVNIHLKYNRKFEYLEIDLTPRPIDIKINLDYKISRV